MHRHFLFQKLVLNRQSVQLLLVEVHHLCQFSVFLERKSLLLCFNLIQRLHVKFLQRGHVVLHLDVNDRVLQLGYVVLLAFVLRFQRLFILLVVCILVDQTRLQI